RSNSRKTSGPGSDPRSPRCIASAAGFCCGASGSIMLRPKRLSAARSRSGLSKSKFYGANSLVDVVGPKREVISRRITATCHHFQVVVIPSDEGRRVFRFPACRYAWISPDSHETPASVRTRLRAAIAYLRHPALAMLLPEAAQGAADRTALLGKR